jgi:hypothetical protein
MLARVLNVVVTGELKTPSLLLRGRT